MEKHEQLFNYLIKRYGLDKVIQRPPIIAVDFDGTLVTQDTFPKIGKKKEYICNLVNKMYDCGMYIILYTCRSGKELDEAVKWCKENEVKISAVNQNHPIVFGFADKKIFADVYIDDRAFSVYDETAYIDIKHREDGFNEKSFNYS